LAIYFKRSRKSSKPMSTNNLPLKPLFSERRVASLLGMAPEELRVLARSPHEYYRPYDKEKTKNGRACLTAAGVPRVRRIDK